MTMNPPCRRSLDQCRRFSWLARQRHRRQRIIETENVSPRSTHQLRRYWSQKSLALLSLEEPVNAIFISKVPVASKRHISQVIQ